MSDSIAEFAAEVLGEFEKAHTFLAKTVVDGGLEQRAYDRICGEMSGIKICRDLLKKVYRAPDTVEGEKPEADIEDRGDIQRDAEHEKDES